MAKIELPEGWAGVAEPLRALMAEAVQRAIRPLAKPVQIVGVVSIRAAANANRSAAPSTRGHGARTAADRS